MKYNARCWTPPAVVLWIVMISLSACEREASKGWPSICPPVVQYDQKTQDRTALEVDGLSEGAAITQMLNDYVVLRHQARACK